MPKQRHVPTEITRRAVANAVAARWRIIDIAHALGISAGTVSEVYRVEIDRGAARLKIDVLDAMFRSAMRGRVSAMKEFLARPGARKIRGRRQRW